MANFASIFFQLGADAKGLETDLKRAQRTTEKRSKAMRKQFRQTAKRAAAIGTALAGGLAFAAKQSLDSADKIKRTADGIGVSVKRFQELEVAFTRFGLKTEDVADAMATLTDRAQDAKSGMKSFQDDFEMIGISVDDLRNKDPAELFDLFAKAIGNTEDPSRRTTAAVRILGDEVGQKLLPLLRRGKEGLDEFARQANEMGLVMDRAMLEKAEQASNELDLLSKVITKRFTVAVAENADQIARAATELTSLLVTGVDFINWATNNAGAAEQLENRLADLEGAANSFVVTMTKPERDIWNAIGDVDEINRIRDAVEQLQMDVIMGEARVSMDALNKAIMQGEEAVNQYADKARKAAKEQKDLARETDNTADSVDKAATSMEGLSKITTDLAEKTSKDFLDAQQDLVDSYVDLVAEANPAIKTLKDMADKQEEMNNLQEKGFVITERMRQSILAQAAGLDAAATQQEIFNKLMQDAGVPEEVLETWREFVNLLATAAGLGGTSSGSSSNNEEQRGNVGSRGPVSGVVSEIPDIGDTEMALGRVGDLGIQNAQGQDLSGAQIGATMGALVGSIIPVIGTALGAAIGTLLGAISDTFFSSGAGEDPRFNIQSQQPSFSGLDQQQDTVFGSLASGTVFNMDENKIRSILDQVANFDRELSRIFDPSDYDAITASLAQFDEDFRASGANAEEVMRRRFIAALDAAEPAISEFVQSFGSLQEMQGALEGIESIRDALDDFSNVMLAMGDPVDQLNARLNRMQTGIDEASTAMEQALFSEDPQAIAQAGQNLQQAILEKFELEKKLIENLQDSLRQLELSGRAFRMGIAERLADLGGPEDAANLAGVAGRNRQAARQDVLNADDTQQALRDLDRFVDATDQWLDAARRRVESLRDAELDRINNQMQALETEADEILARGRQRAQSAQQASQAAAQAAQRARQAELDALNEQLNLAREWQSVLDSTQKMIKDLTFSQVNPANRFSRLDQLNQRIQGQGTGTPEGAREMQDLLQRRLNIGQELFQRGSSEFGSLFNDTMKRLSEIEGKAKSEAEVANELQQKANELQSQTTGAVSAGTSSSIRLSSKEQQRLEEIREEQAALEAEAQEVRENAEQSLANIDERARGFYEWAQGQRETLEQARHEALINRLHTITGGMPADEYIAQRQDDVVALLGGIRTDLQNFLSAISSGSTGPGTGPGGPGGPDPGGPGGPNPGITQGAGNKTVTFNFNGSGMSKKDINRLITHINREIRTA